MSKFTLEAAPSQKGKIAIVTGANDGIGYETALGLAKKGAKLIMACRNSAKAQKAISKITNEVPNADLSFIKLDLNSLQSVKDFVTSFKQEHKQLDILVNNAGIMVPPFTKTEEGFESQMGVNYFAHFLLTGLLLNELNAADQGRIISLSSIAHRSGKIDFDNLNAENKYAKVKAYGQSKLACLMFAYELDRRLKSSGSKVISVASHPGVSATNLIKHMSPFLRIVMVPILRPFFNSPSAAALPSLMAAMEPSAVGGDYYGPTGMGEMRGKPAKVEAKAHAHDESVAKKLWEVSENLVNFKFEF